MCITEYLYQMLLSVWFRMKAFIQKLNATHSGTLYNVEESEEIAKQLGLIE